MKTMASILPVLFLAIAILTMVTTMHRICASEKTQIGTLKALGFKDRRILPGDLAGQRPADLRRLAVRGPDGRPQEPAYRYGGGAEDGRMIRIDEQKGICYHLCG